MPVNRKQRQLSLYVKGFPGELGWEICNYVPYVNYVVRQKPYRKVVVCCRPDRQSLYPFATHYRSSSMPTDKGVVGNSGPRGPIFQKEALGDRKIVQKMTKNGWKVTVVHPFTDRASNVRGRRRMFFWSKKRAPFKYTPSQEGVEKWKEIIPDNAIALCIRNRNHKRKKNWTIKHCLDLSKRLIKFGYVPVFLGLPVNGFKPPKPSVNLLGKTDMSDLIAVFSMVNLVVGQSTGIMHLASHCGAPHVVWGSKRIKKRYLSTWNPLGTPAKFIAQANWSPTNVSIMTAIKEMLS